MHTKSSFPLASGVASSRSSRAASRCRVAAAPAGAAAGAAAGGAAVVGGAEARTAAATAASCARTSALACSPTWSTSPRAAMADVMLPVARRRRWTRRRGGKTFPRDAPCLVGVEPPPRLQLLRVAGAWPWMSAATSPEFEEPPLAHLVGPPGPRRASQRTGAPRAACWAAAACCCASPRRGAPAFLGVPVLRFLRRRRPASTIGRVGVESADLEDSEDRPRRQCADIAEERG